MKIRTDWADTPLVTDLTWNPHAVSPVRHPRRGALIGTLLGVPVTGKSCGRAIAYQFQMLTGEVRTVWWDGTMYGDAPYLRDVDTGEPVLRDPAGIAWFSRLENAGSHE